MKETTKKTSNQILSDFLTSNKNVLLIILAVIVVVIASVGVYSTLEKNKVSLIGNSISTIDIMFDEIMNSKGDKDEFISYCSEVVEESAGTKAELIAYSRLASMYFDDQNFEKALENYTNAYVKFPNDLAASVYMFNAAMTLEELENSEKAITLLEELVSNFKSSKIDKADLSADVPEAIFNLARLYEKLGNEEKAINNYEILVAEYQNYNLTNLAKTRLITLK